MSSITPSWPCDVYGSSATSVMTPSSGKRFFSAATARGTSPLGLNASRPSAVFSFCSIAGNSASAGISQLQALLGDRQQLVDGEALDAGHGSHFLSAGFAVDDEHRIDQVVRR